MAKALKPGTVDDYIAAAPQDIRKLLEQIRHTIQNACPEAEEMISYNMPLYKWKGMLVSFAAWKSHIGLYPAPNADKVLKAKLARYAGSKATLKFPFDEPLPIPLIKKIVKARMDENVMRAEAKAVAKASRKKVR